MTRYCPGRAIDLETYRQHLMSFGASDPCQRSLIGIPPTPHQMQPCRTSPSTVAVVWRDRVLDVADVGGNPGIV